MVNPLGHWLRVLFCTRSWIPLRGLSGFRGIGFRIPLRGLSGFQVPPGLVVPALVLEWKKHNGTIAVFFVNEAIFQGIIGWGLA